ncbi:MAG: UbiA family prenyltransferase [Nocardioides sp.]
MTALVRAAHPGPALAVTALVALLAWHAGLDAGTLTLVVAAVLAGQLSIGWSNDLIDAARDRQVGRADKPLVTGSLDTRAVAIACVAALVAAVALSSALGLVAGLVNLLLHVGGGWAYNLGLKATAWSWVPYAVAFGALPAVVALAAGDPVAWSACVAGGLLGVGAHLLNALPDLDDDAATGVRGLPHRLGTRWAAPVAVVVLAVATVVVVGAAPVSGPAATWLPIAAVAALSAVALRSSGRTAFRAAVGIALVDVLVLVTAP